MTNREMAFKQLVASILFVLFFARETKSGVISLETDPLQDPHVSLASSFMHFHGPVEGPEFQVKVPYVAHSYAGHGQDHEDHGYAIDYVAHPKYEFSYGVEDHHTGDFHGQKESRDGSSVSGEYSVKEPGGTLRVVRYHADKDGFHAVVHTSGRNDHSGHGQGHYLAGREEQVLQDYALTYADHEGY